MAKTKQEKKYVMACPKCKSTDVGVDFSNAAGMAYGVRPPYICNKCGFKAKIFPEFSTSELPDYVPGKALRNEGEIDVSEGTFLGHFVWKISSPIALFLSIGFFQIDYRFGILFLITWIVTGYFAYFRKFKK